MPSIAHLIHAYGLLVVSGTIGLEGVGFPVRGETSLIVASVIAGTHHEINIVAVILTAAIASIVGRSVGYLIRRYFGYWLLLRYGGYIWISEARIKLGQYLFLRHGGKIVIVAQFVPVLRTIAGIMAGANRMPWTRFLLANIFGAFAWAIFFGTAAYTLGRQVERLAGWGVVVLVIATVIVVVVAAHFV